MKRILFAIPLVYGADWGFWTRDSGLVVLALRKMGYDAYLVGLGDPTAPSEGWPILRASLQDLSTAQWWQEQRPDAIILTTWSAPRYDAIRRAALGATPLVVERLDTDGTKSVHLFPREGIIRAWGRYSDKLPASLRWLAMPLALARFLIRYLFPSYFDAKMVATMQQLPGLISETPIAANRMQRMIHRFSGRNHRIAVIPHPVNEDILKYKGTAKQNRIITVGRWNTAAKDFPMLRRVIKKFLEQHPDWEAIVVGKDIPADAFSTQITTEDWATRVTCHGHLRHEELVMEYNRSKIYLMVSRYESFCIAAAEALCCGCSVVGSSKIASSYYFAETESGTVAASRMPEAFLASMDAEIHSWAHGERDPQKISSLWVDRVGANAVARSVLSFFDEIQAAQKK